MATNGREGWGGIPAFLGAHTAPMQPFVQIPGEALRMRVEALHEVAKDILFTHVLNRYVQCFITQIAQTSACNRIHSLDERCVRWLLMTHDRVEADEFPMTQEFLGALLAPRRAGVSIAAATMQRAGLVDYERGLIKILDRAGLEAASCECYAIVTAEYDRLLGTDFLRAKKQQHRRLRSSRQRLCPRLHCLTSANADSTSTGDSDGILHVAGTRPARRRCLSWQTTNQLFKAVADVAELIRMAGDPRRQAIADGPHLGDAPLSIAFYLGGPGHIQHGVGSFDKGTHQA